MPLKKINPLFSSINHSIRWISIWVVILITFLHSNIYAQVPSSEEDSSAIELIFSKKMKGVQKQEGDYYSLEGEVHLQQQNMHLWCDTAHRYPEKQIIAFGNVEMLQNNNLRIYSDSLFYDGNTKKAKLVGNVVLEDSSMTIFTDYLLYDLNSRIADYPKGALVISDSNELVSKSGYYDANTNIAYFIDSVRLNNPNYKLFADSLAFNTDTETAYFISKTYIFNEEDLVYCENGYYDNKNNYAVLTGDPYYLNRKKESYKKASGDSIIYDGKLRKYYLISNAVFEDGQKALKADTIERDEISEQYYFKGNPKFLNLDSTKNQTIDSKYSFYDTKNDVIKFIDNVKIVDNNQLMVADSLDYNQKTKTGIVKGKVVWNDSLSKTKILCGKAIYNDSLGTMLAMDNPILVSQINNDTMWMISDTLRSKSAGKEKDKKIFYAYHHVKIFKSDLQALTDSLTYSQYDSVFQFFGKPILWVDSVQFTADTIFANLKNNKIDQVFLNKNSIIISTEDQLYFNQIRGRNMNAIFMDNKIDKLDVISNGKAVYYASDNNKGYMGVNEVECTDMNMNFKDNQIQRIKFIGEPKAILHPMGMVDHLSIRLKEFIWNEGIRPKSKFEIIGNNDWSYRLSEIGNIFPESKID